MIKAHFKQRSSQCLANFLAQTRIGSHHKRKVQPRIDRQEAADGQRMHAPQQNESEIPTIDASQIDDTWPIDVGLFDHVSP